MDGDSNHDGHTHGRSGPGLMIAAVLLALAGTAALFYFKCEGQAGLASIVALIGSASLAVSGFLWASARANPGRERLARVEGELRISTHALEQAVEGIARLDPDGRYVYVNQEYASILRDTPERVIGALCKDSIHPDDMDAFCAAREGMKRNGKATGTVRRLGADGSTIFAEVTILSILDRSGAYLGNYCFMKDVSERRRQEEDLKRSLQDVESLLARERTLMRELDHRVRNNLTSLLGLVGMYRRAGGDGAEVARGIRDKIHALSEVHNIIGGSRTRDVDIGELLARLAGAWLPTERLASLSASGPTVVLPGARADAVAMIVQELLTNARKYGALSCDKGRVRVTWSRPDNHAVEFLWEESGCPINPAEQGRGVGLELIRGLTASELCGQATFDFHEAGLKFRLLIDMSEETLRTSESQPPLVMAHHD